MLKIILSTIDNASFLLLEAPTGTGKTTIAMISSIFASINTGKRVIFSVRSYPLLDKVINEIFTYASQLGINDISIVAFRGKEKSCLYASRYNLGSGVYSYCDYLRSFQLCEYYVSFLNRYGEIHRVYKKDTKKYMLTPFLQDDWCPYYSTKNFLGDADIIITHYFNVFHYHNIPRYYFELYTPLIKLSDLYFSSESDCFSKTLRKLLKNILINRLKENKNNGDLLHTEDIISIEQLYTLNRELFYESLENELIRVNGRCKDVFHYIKNLCDLLLHLYEESRIYCDDDHLMVIPERKLSSLPTIFDKYYSVVGISATLSPINHYREIFFNGLNRDINIFQSERLPPNLPKIRFFFKREYTSKYRNRTMTLIERVSKDIVDIVLDNGSSIVFSASQDLSKILETELKRVLIPTEYSHITIFNIDESDEFLIPDSIPDENAFIILASQRGRFNEGIKFPSYIKNIIIFGLSITPPSLKEKFLAKYVLKRHKEKDIFKYGYLLPAVTVFIQSIGRLIRRGKQDINVYVFEHRVLKHSILEMMPRWFRDAVENYIDISSL